MLWSYIIIQWWWWLFGRWHVAGYTQVRIHPWTNEVGVGSLCRSPGRLWESMRKRTHTQLVWEHTVTVYIQCVFVTYHKSFFFFFFFLCYGNRTTLPTSVHVLDQYAEKEVMREIKKQTKPRGRRRNKTKKQQHKNDEEEEEDEDGRCLTLGIWRPANHEGLYQGQRQVTISQAKIWPAVHKTLYVWREFGNKWS